MMDIEKYGFAMDEVLAGVGVDIIRWRGVGDLGEKR